MAWHRLEHARSRVNELDRMKMKHLQGRRGANGQGFGGNVPPGSST